MMKERSKENCCGCTACASICPKEAITMRPDGLGFLYPSFDRTKCIECGLCEKICSFNNFREIDNDRAKPEAFAVRHKDINEIETSRSGAAFIALSDWILGHNGIIYGAGYQKHFKVIHKRAENKEQRDEFKGSKYVQSDLTGVFSQIKADLLDGRLVWYPLPNSRSIFFYRSKTQSKFISHRYCLPWSTVTIRMGRLPDIH